MPEPSSTDPFLWLEDVTGDAALDWVRAHNQPTLDELCDDKFEQMRSEALEVLDTDARIPYVRRRGELLYNYWRDGANPRGLWRRTTLAEYRKAEASVLLRQEYTIDVDGSSRRFRYADLKAVQDMIRELEDKIASEERKATRGRRVHYLVPR